MRSFRKESDPHTRKILGPVAHGRVLRGLPSHEAGRVFLRAVLAALLLPKVTSCEELPLVPNVDLQPLAAQALRVMETMEYLGTPFDPGDQEALRRAVEEKEHRRGSIQIQRVLDKYVLAGVQIDVESRVKVAQGSARPELVEQGWRPFLVKVYNLAGVTAELAVRSPNSAPLYTPSSGSATPKQILRPSDLRNRWLDLFLYSKRPMRPRLSGLELEYAILQLFSRDVGKREATISFNVGQGTQDIGFRNDVSIAFSCRPSVHVTLKVLDENGRPTIGSFIFRDTRGQIYPSQAKRLAPDFFFQPQVYRADGDTVDLPAGRYEVEYTRGPEYAVRKRTVEIAPVTRQTAAFRMERWIDPPKNGWYPGDHHIHAAGCAHYEDPTQGVFPKDMIRHIKGEALSVGDVLTWGPCFYFQKQFFTGRVDKLSTPENILRYDIEVSGFPSSHCGHLVLLRLKEQDYPGTERIEDWPTWDLPILKWARSQGAVVGFAHSGWGLEAKTDELPNYEMPAFDGIGANEYIVDVTHGMVDFISAADTPSRWELNIWYHTLNCGFRTRLSGETDFPCIYGKRVGMGRVYVKEDEKLDYTSWVEGVRAGRSYVSDGKSHLMNFTVNGILVGTQHSEVRLAKPGVVRVTARVAARLNEQPDQAIRYLPNDEKPYWDLERARLGETRHVPVEVVVNGLPVAHTTILADGSLRQITFDVPIGRSSWIALRILPSSHTNPIFVLVDNKAVRGSRRSAEWCLKAVDQCWTQKAAHISEKERPEAESAYQHARDVYRRIAQECAVE